MGTLNAGADGGGGGGSFVVLANGSPVVVAGGGGGGTSSSSNAYAAASCLTGCSVAGQAASVTDGSICSTSGNMGSACGKSIRDEFDVRRSLTLTSPRQASPASAPRPSPAASTAGRAWATAAAAG